MKVCTMKKINAIDKIKKSMQLTNLGKVNFQLHENFCIVTTPIVKICLTTSLSRISI